MPRKRKTGRAYIANQSFVVNLDTNGKVMTDGSGIDKSFHEGRTRAYEGDGVVDWMPDWFDELEDVDMAQSYE
jgi:hypothetical protein